MKRFRGGLVFKAHRWLYHSTLGSRVIKKKRKNKDPAPDDETVGGRGAGAESASVLLWRVR